MRPLGEVPYLVLDARYEKVRHGGAVVSCAVLIAVGVDLLGHRSAESTEIYLRLATEDLRAIGIDLPKKGEACRTGRTKTKR